MKEVSQSNEHGKPILWVGGSKGGVGKSMVTMALIDHLRSKEDDVVLVECDTSNPDVFKSHRDEIPIVHINLDEADGWIELVNVCDTKRESTILVNTPARNNAAVGEYGSTLDRSLGELGRKLVVLWVINRQRDGLELLKDFRESIPNAVVHVVRNAYFGDEKKFELYNCSKLKEAVEAAGGKSLTFPDLADRVADDLYTKRLSIAAAAKALPIGNRMELGRWRSEVGRMLGDIL